MARRWSWVSALELFSVLAFAGLLGVYLLGRRPVDEPGAPIDFGDLVAGESEEWRGIYLEDAKMGWAVSRETPLPDGALRVRDQSYVRLTAFGQERDITTFSETELDENLRARRFRYRLEAGPATFEVRGEPLPNGQGLDIAIIQGGERIQGLELEERPFLPLAMWKAVRARGFAANTEHRLLVFDPAVMTEVDLIVRIEDPEDLPNGSRGWNASFSYQGAEGSALVAEDGTVLREEGLLGMVTVRETRESALESGWDGPAPDLIALSMVPIDVPLANPRQVRRLELRVTGSEAAVALVERANQERYDPDTGILWIEATPVDEWETAPLPMSRDEFDTTLAPERFIQVDHPEIQQTAGLIVGDDLDAEFAAKALTQWVYETIVKEPVVGVPGALEVLRNRRGDCNEHTTLFTALSRAVGLPTRIAAGLVYSDSDFLGRGFYYHAWPEVWLGRWVGLDPTFGQAPADATHLPLVYGGLAAQAEIAAALGQLQLELVSVEEGL